MRHAVTVHCRSLQPRPLQHKVSTKQMAAMKCGLFVKFEVLANYAGLAPVKALPFTIEYHILEPVRMGRCMFPRRCLNLVLLRWSTVSKIVPRWHTSRSQMAVQVWGIHTAITDRFKGSWQLLDVNGVTLSLTPRQTWQRECGVMMHSLLKRRQSLTSSITTPTCTSQSPCQWKHCSDYY